MIRRLALALLLAFFGSTLSAATIPPFDPSDRGRGDQRTSEAMVRCVVEAACPAWLPELIPDIRKRIGDCDEPEAGGCLQNLRHLALATALQLRVSGTTERLLQFYALDRMYHRGSFEGGSVGYGRYQTIAAWSVMLSPYASPELALEAREFLRREYTMMAIQADRHGHIVGACGRAYAKESLSWTAGGAIDPALDFEIRVLLKIDGDGWWPPRGVGPKFWTPHRDSLPAWWARERPEFAARVFSDAERDALRAWVDRRELRPELASLLGPIRWPPALHVLAAPGWHLAWTEALGSYGGGKNASQPIALSDQVGDRWVVREPPSGARRVSSGAWVVSGHKAPDLTVELDVPAGAVELVIDAEGGRVAGKSPLVGQVTPPPSPPAKPVEPTTGTPPAADGCRAAALDAAALLERAAGKIKAGEVAGWPAALRGAAGELREACGASDR